MARVSSRHRETHGVHARRLLAASPPETKPRSSQIRKRAEHGDDAMSRALLAHVLHRPPLLGYARARALPCAQPIRLFLAADSDTCVVFAAWLRSSRSGAGARGLLASRIHPLRRLNCSAAEAAPGPTEEAPASPARKYAPRLPARVVFDVML